MGLFLEESFILKKCSTDTDHLKGRYRTYIPYYKHLWTFFSEKSYLKNVSYPMYVNSGKISLHLEGVLEYVRLGYVWLYRLGYEVGERRFEGVGV